MDFNRLSSPTLKELFIKEIESMIFSGKLSIGDKLPPERILAEKMDVSRSVVNAGLADLARKGFVEIQPRSGVVISDYRRRGSVETLLAMLHYNGGNLRKNDIRSLLEIRLVIETLAIEQAVPRISPKEIGFFRNLAGSLHSAESSSAAAGIIFEFHHELCALSGNTLLPLIFYSFNELSKMLWEKYFDRYGTEKLYQSTGDLIDCFERKDVPGALRAFQTSLKETMEGDYPIYPDTAF